MARMADPVTAYAQGVVKGKTIAGRSVVRACERHLRDKKEQKARGLEWRVSLAQRAIDFFAEILVLEDGRHFELLDFQQFIVGSIFGWYSKDGNRRFRTAYVETGKGSGKSPLAAGIGIYGLVADEEPAPEVYSAAVTHEQARIVFKDAYRMVEAEPELMGLVQRQVGSLTIPKRSATFRPVSSEHRGLDGLRVHFGLIDEFHEHPTSMVVDKIRAGTKRRKNALLLIITNAGWDRTSACWKHHEYSIKLLEGTAGNDSWFAYISQLDEGDDWRDPKVWPKANPGMAAGLPPRKYLEEQVEEAKGMPSKENIVRRLNFCEWTEQSERWLDMDLWDGCPGTPINVDSLQGRPCMAGLDAASTADLTAHVMLFGPDEDGLYDVMARFWLPESSLASKDSGRAEEARLRLVQWVREGWIKTTPGETTDYDLVEQDILEDLKNYELKRLSFDRWGVTQLITHLKDALGQERVVDFPQTVSAMSAPTKELEKIIRDGKLRHGGNPVLRWMASNVALMYGRDQQIKPDRKASGDKIDGIVALIMALDGAMREKSGPSVYDERIARGEEVLKFV